MKRSNAKNAHAMPIGLDVGSRYVKAIQFAPYSSGLRVVAAAMVSRTVEESVASPVAGAPEVPVTPDRRTKTPGSVKAAPAQIFHTGPLTADEIQTLRDVLARSGFEGDRVVLAAPPAVLLQSVLELPPRSSQAPIEQIARLELARSHKCAPDSFEMGCWDLPPVAAGQSVKAGKGTLVMAVGYPHAAADPILDAFDAAGLQVVALDAAPCAIARACAPAAVLVGPEGGMTAILDLGWSAASLSLIHCGAIIYGRVLADGGLGTLHHTLVRRLNLELDVVDYLLTEVGLSVRLPVGDDDQTDPNGEEAIDLPEDARGLLAAHIDGLVRELLASFSYASRQYPHCAGFPAFAGRRRGCDPRAW